jgi:hypothetical protein
LPRADGCLAVIVEEFDQFVDDFGFVFLAGPGVTRPLLGQHFRSWVLTHLGGHSSGTPFLRQRMVSSIHLSPPSVTFFLSQFATRKSIAGSDFIFDNPPGIVCGGANRVSALGDWFFFCRECFSQAGRQQFCDPLPAFLPVLIQFLAVNQPQARKSHEADQGSQAHCVNKVKHERWSIVGKVVHKNLAIAQSGHGQCRQQGRQSHGAAHTAQVALDPGEFFRHQMTLMALVVKETLLQKLGMFLVLAHAG